MKRRIWTAPAGLPPTPVVRRLDWPGRRNTLFGAVPMITRTACHTVQNGGYRAVVAASERDAVLQLIRSVSDRIAVYMLLDRRGARMQTSA